MLTSVQVFQAVDQACQVGIGEQKALAVSGQDEEEKINVGLQCLKSSEHLQQKSANEL